MQRVMMQSANLEQVILHQNESFTLDVLVQMIAQPGQTITIQNTNIAYGNTEFEITT